jgi:hypothetical protein
MKNVEVLRNTEPEQELIASSDCWQAAFDHRNERLSRHLPKMKAPLIWQLITAIVMFHH